MESIDARKVPEGLYERRKQVVRLSKKGYGPMAVAELTGLSWGAVNAALFAVAILAQGDERIRQALDDYRAAQTKKVLEAKLP